MKKFCLFVAFFGALQYAQAQKTISDSLLYVLTNEFSLDKDLNVYFQGEQIQPDTLWEPDNNHIFFGFKLRVRTLLFRGLYDFGTFVVSPWGQFDWEGISEKDKIALYEGLYERLVADLAESAEPEIQTETEEPVVAYKQPSQLRQNCDQVGIPRRWVTTPDGVTTLAAGEVQHVTEKNSEPFYTFLGSGSAGGTRVWIKVRNLTGPQFLDTDFPWTTDTYIDTFNLQVIYTYLLKKTQQYGTKISDGASNEVTMGIATIQFQKTPDGILLAWWDGFGAYLWVTLTPQGTLINLKQKNTPKNFSAIALVYVIKESNFNLWDSD
jgi:hypothetical protein